MVSLVFRADSITFKFWKESLPKTLESISIKITNQKQGITKEVEIKPSGNLITNLDVEAIPALLEDGELKIEKIDAGTPDAKVVVSEDKFMVPDRCIDETNLSDPVDGDMNLNNSKNQLPVPQVIVPGEEAGSRCLAIAGSVEEEENPVAAVMYMDNLVYELEDDVYQLAYANLGSEGKSVYEDANTFFQYHLKDHLGSTRMVLAEDLSLKESMAYHPYGQEVPIDVDRSGAKLRDKFTGKELDDEGSAGVVHLDITITGFTSTTGSEGELIITYVDGGEKKVIELQNLDLSGTVVQYQQIVSLLSEKVIDHLELIVTGTEPEEITSYPFDVDNDDGDYSEVIEMGDKVTLTLTETVQDINGGGSGGYTVYNEDDSYVGLDLSYFGARYYDAEIGRWTSVDPIPQMFDIYGYCSMNPINRFDPNGKLWDYLGDSWLQSKAEDNISSCGSDLAIAAYNSIKEDLQYTAQVMVGADVYKAGTGPDGKMIWGGELGYGSAGQPEEALHAVVHRDWMKSGGSKNYGRYQLRNLGEEIAIKSRLSGKTDRNTLKGIKNKKLDEYRMNSETYGGMWRFIARLKWRKVFRETNRTLDAYENKNK